MNSGNSLTCGMLVPSLHVNGIRRRQKQTAPTSIRGGMHHAGITHAPRTLPASDPPARMSEMRRPHDAGGDCARPGGLELRTFECRRCDHSFTNAVAKDPMNTVSAGWITGELKAPT